MQAYRNELRAVREKQLKDQSCATSSAKSSMGGLQANFSLVAGTELLNEQLQRLKPNVHIFGRIQESMDRVTLRGFQP